MGSGVVERHIISIECTICFDTIHGDWESGAYKKYIAFSFEDKLQVALRMRLHILSDEDIRTTFVLRLNVPVNNFSVMSGRSHRFLGITSTFRE